MKKQPMSERLADPKYLCKLLRRQRRFNGRVMILMMALGIYILKAEERAIRQELKVDHLQRTLGELRREKGV